MRALLGIWLACCLCVAAAAQDTETPSLSSPIDAQVSEQRAREIGRALRCVVCQNQSIEESDASLAEDMRRLVRARVRSGDSNEEVIAYMQNRYGDFVLLKPPVQPSTYILWFGPFILALLGLLWFLRGARKPPKTAPAAPLTATELAILDKLDHSKDEA